MKTDKQNLGATGENKASEYLKKSGFTIIARNYRFKRAEIDIICHNKESLLFVEVKSVRVKNYGSGEERISRNKRKLMIKTAYHFLEEHKKYNNFNVQFDVIVVNFNTYPAEILHYPSAFWAEY